MLSCSRKPGINIPLYSRPNVPSANQQPDFIPSIEPDVETQMQETIADGKPDLESGTHHAVQALDIEHAEVEDDPRKWSPLRKVGVTIHAV